MKTIYFKNCNSLDEVKREYKRLALIHHPDRGGDTAIMQEINRQYQEIIKNPSCGFSKANEQAQNDYVRFPEIISQIVKLDITIEICGNWIWLSGKTYHYTEKLKELGFFWARKKGMWYWRPEDFKSAGKKSMDMNYIRAKYGSDVIPTEKGQRLKEEEADR
jgi:hypothetical protein